MILLEVHKFFTETAGSSRFCGFKESSENPKQSIIILGWQVTEVLDDCLSPPVPINHTSNMLKQFKYAFVPYICS